MTLPPAIMHPFDHAEASAEALARHCLDAWQHHRQQQSRPFHVGLSGGKTPVPFLQHLVQRLCERSQDLSDLWLWWCDERAVPPDHADSNYGLVQTHLLSPLQQCLPPEAQPHTERLRGEVRPLAEEAARYTQALTDIGALDYVVLGMGDDGHTASLFPGQPEAKQACFVSQHPEGDSRLTLSSAFLKQSHQRVLLYNGAQKQDTWEAAQHSEDVERYPILRIQAAGDLHVFFGRSSLE